MTGRSAFALFVRSVGAVHSGVAAYLLLPPIWKVPPLVSAVAVGCAVYAVGSSLTHQTRVKDVLLAAYVGPLLFFAAAYLLVNSPATWAEAGGLLKPFLVAVFSGTHPAAYLACLSFACLTAERPRDPGLYR